jgi:hypothetical protein
MGRQEVVTLYIVISAIETVSWQKTLSTKIRFPTLQVMHAARLLLERGYTVDIAYTSMLKRAIRSSWILLKELDQVYRPCLKSWRLNERMYVLPTHICNHSYRTSRPTVGDLVTYYRYYVRPKFYFNAGFCSLGNSCLHCYHIFSTQFHRTVCVWHLSLHAACWCLLLCCIAGTALWKVCLSPSWLQSWEKS